MDKKNKQHPFHRNLPLEVGLTAATRKFMASATQSPVASTPLVADAAIIQFRILSGKRALNAKASHKAQG